MTNFDIAEHGHGGSYPPHTHAWASHSHNHFMRAVCNREECSGSETHNIHGRPND